MVLGGAERERELSADGAGLPEDPRPAFPRGGGAGGVRARRSRARGGAAPAVERGRAAAVANFPAK